MEAETRFIPLDGLEVRTDENGEPRGITGTAAVYNRGTVIAGMFEERIEPGAFDDVLESDVRGLFNHDPNYPLGRTSAGTMSLRSTKKALVYDIPELPRARADVLEAIQRGDVTGNSFSFVVESDEDEVWTNRDKEKKLPLRIIKRVGRLMDVGPVTFPAYPQTQVSARAEERCKAVAEPEPPAFEHLQANRRRRLDLLRLD